MAGSIIWFVGLSGSGKTTLASRLETLLKHRSQRVAVLDGDVLRKGLCSDLGFSLSDRAENIRRIAHVAKLFSDLGFTAIVATISPLRIHREIAKAIIPRAFQVFVDAPLAICEARDPKGLYRKVRSGQLSGFTGIDAPFERPLDYDLSCRTDRETIEESVMKIIAAIESGDDRTHSHLKPSIQASEPNEFTVP